MKVLLRTDASLQIGIGHVMRCLTLADALRAYGAECTFVCREHPGHLLERIRQRGFAAHGLSATSEDIVPIVTQAKTRTNYSGWLGIDWSSDAAETRHVAGDTVMDWLIVDHYALDARWEKALRPTCHQLMVIDDLADRPHDCDILLDQNLGRAERDYPDLVPDHCALLMGPNYALLRPEFADLRDYSLRRRSVPKLRHLLIAMGGVDEADATGAILEVLKDCTLPADCSITVVLGPHAPWLERVRLLAAQMPYPTELRVNVCNMAQLMADSDLAIGAAGSTSWERCCLGLPTLIVTLAENQRQGAAALERSGCAMVLGNSDKISGNLRSMLSRLTTTRNLRQQSQASCSITDGQGASRVALVLAENNG